jgi:cobalt/nickel transport system permease protein
MALAAKKANLEGVMKQSLDFPDCFHSPLGRIDPRWKIAALAPFTLAAALLEFILPALAAFLLALVLVFLARIPRPWLCKRLAGVALFLALFILWLPFAVPGEALEIGPMSLSWAGLTLAGLVLLKALTIVTVMLVLWTTAPLNNTLKAAHALRCPGLIVQLIVLTYRYVFLLLEELGRLRIALRVRGYRHRANLHSYRTVGHVTGTLLLRSYEQAERVGQAMRCRGFDGRFCSLAQFQTRTADLVWFLAILIAAAGLLVWDRWR